MLNRVFFIYSYKVMSESCSRLNIFFIINSLYLPPDDKVHTLFVMLCFQFLLVCDLDYVSTFCTTMAMLGILFGAGISGQLTDTFGRRPVFFSFGFLMILCQLCQSFATSWQMFAGFRLFGGLLAGWLDFSIIL